MDDLAREVGLSRLAVDFIKKGKGEGLSFKQLSGVADYFARGVALESGPIDEASCHTPQFRRLNSQKTKLSPVLRAFIRRVEKQRDIYMSLCEDLDADERPAFTPPNVTGLSSEQAAGVARNWLKLSDNNGFDTYREALEAKGLLVFRSNGYPGKWQISKEDPILGFALYHETYPLILVKKQSAEAQQCFTLMHELGHILLHQSSFIDDLSDVDSTQSREREANAFAGYLLVPKALLDTVVDADRPAHFADYEQWLDK